MGLGSKKLFEIIRSKFGSIIKFQLLYLSHTTDE